MNHLNPTIAVLRQLWILWIFLDENYDIHKGIILEERENYPIGTNTKTIEKVISKRHQAMMFTMKAYFDEYKVLWNDLKNPYQLGIISSQIQ